MYTSCGDPFQAISVWKQLDFDKLGTPNEFIYCAILNACAETSNLTLGERICQQMDSQTLAVRSTILVTTIIKFYLNGGKPVLALKEWERVHDSIEFDELLTCYVLLACAASKDLEMTNSVVKSLVSFFMHEFLYLLYLIERRNTCQCISA